VRSPDLASVPASLTQRGEIRAGEHFEGKLGPGECVAIMTGAPLPAGTDAVVMLEHATWRNTVKMDRAAPRETCGAGKEARKERRTASRQAPGRGRNRTSPGG
jgi:molybdopterin molybdotransferase